MDKRSFEFIEGTSSKFWEIWVDGTQVRTRYGRIGSDGQVTVKDEGDTAKAAKLYTKLIAEKTKKGYRETTAGAAPAETKSAAAPAKAEKPAKADKPVKAAKPEATDDEGDDGYRRFEVDEKFWAIRVSDDGLSVSVKFGKQGTNGQEKTKSFGDATSAKKEYDKLVKEKTGKGYEEV